MTMSVVQALKATLDYEVDAIASGLGLDFVDLDGVALNSERLLEANNAIAWQKTGGTTGTGPWFDLTFDVGAITNNSTDPNQQVSASLVDAIVSRFQPGTTVDVYPYPDTSSKLACFLVSSAQEQPRVADVVEGFRAVTITGTGVKLA